MSQHSSLRAGRRAKQHRSVLKRFERMKILQEKGEWKEGDSVFGIPKVKTLRIKLKKEKAAEAAKPEENAAATTAAPQAPAEKGTAKSAAVKPAAVKPAAAKAAAPAKEAPKKEAKKEK